MGIAFQIADVLNFQPYNAARRLEQKSRLFSPASIPCLIQAKEKPLLLHRLDQIRHRLHVIALQNIIFQSGDKNDLQIFTLFPQLPGKRNPALARHINIQKQYIALPFIPLSEKELLCALT